MTKRPDEKLNFFTKWFFVAVIALILALEITR